MSDSCLHCRIMDTINKFHEEFGDEQVTGGYVLTAVMTAWRDVLKQAPSDDIRLQLCKATVATVMHEMAPFVAEGEMVEMDQDTPTLDDALTQARGMKH